MKEYYINKHRIKIYNSIEEMPIVNFQKYNKFALIESVIGSDLSSLEQHSLKVMEYLNLNKIDLAKQQLINMRESMYLMAEELSPKYLSFIALIAEIDGKPVTDLSDDNMRAIFDKINKAPKNYIDKILSLFKKKINTELAVYFPKSQNDIYIKEVFTKLKQRNILVLDKIAKDNPNYDEVTKIDIDLLLSNEPKQFSGSNSFEIKVDKQFEELCIMIQKSLNTQVKQLTVFEFYNTLEYIDKETKELSKLAKRK